MMAANKINYKLILLIVSLGLPFSVFASVKVTDKEVINFLYKNVTQSTAKLGVRIEFCEKQRLNSQPILLSIKQLVDLKAKNRDIIVALTHLSFDNTFKCEKNARIKLAYDLGLLASVKTQSKLKTKELDEIKDNLIYPSVKQIRLSIKYLKLPIKLRRYIKETVRNRPFDLIKTLKTNQLLDI